MRFGLITLFPEAVTQFLDTGVVGRAIRQGRVSCRIENPRDHAHDRHRTVDDRPFGGGPGMVMKTAPLVAAISAMRAAVPDGEVVYLSPRGRRFDQRQAEAWQADGSLVLLAGRYEGIDERVVSREVDDEVSLGDFVLSGGEVAALAVIDTVARLVPGVLGHADSAAQDSFSADGLLDYPHYTRPADFDGQQVPSVLLSGDHEAIARWRRQQALEATWERRPDLLHTARLTPSDTEFLKQLERSPAATSDHKRSE